METYKRNQIDEALWELFRIDGNPPAPAFRARIKKLLDLDRAMFANPRLVAGRREPFPDRPAFDDGTIRGHGHDTLFTRTDALALGIALHLGQIGFKQSEIVFVMQEIRGWLDKVQAMMDATPSLTIEWTFPRGDRPGAPLYVDEKGWEYDDTRMYMVIGRIEYKEVMKHYDGPEYAIPAAVLCKGLKALAAEFDSHGVRHGSQVVIPLHSIHAMLTETLPQTSPRRRGRS